MANKDQLKILRQGVEAWNKWRSENSHDQVELSGANLSEMDLRGIDLTGADLRKAVLIDTDLSVADLRWTDLTGAILSETNFSVADLTGAVLIDTDLSWAVLRWAILIDADLTGAFLSWADLAGAILRGAILSNADLSGTDLRGVDLTKAVISRVDFSWALLIETNLMNAILTECNIYGISAWGLKLEGTKQNDLTITPPNQPSIITVDNIEIAQFIYLLIHNKNIRQVIDTITSKVVLILGRFTPERKAMLDAIRDELRKHNYLPVIFDFNKPASRDLTETISTLAHMARFIIADITEAKSIPAELQCIVPNLPSVPVVPLVLRSDSGYALFEHIIRYHWVLEPYEYESQEELIASIGKRIIASAEAKVKECRPA